MPQNSQYPSGTRLDKDGNVISYPAGTKLDSEGRPPVVAPTMPAPPTKRDQLIAQYQAHEATKTTPIGQALRETLPAAGGLVGGMLGGPVGAGILGAGGEAVSQLLARLVGAPAPSSPLDAALAIGKQAGVQGGAQAAGNMLGSVMRRGGAKLMQSALKPTATNLKDAIGGAEIPKVVQTLLDEGVSVTPGGLAKLNQIIETTSGQIDDAIANAPGFVSPQHVASRLTDLERRVATQVNPVDDVALVQRAREEFLSQPGVTTKPGIVGQREVVGPVLDAQGRPVISIEDVAGQVPRDMTVQEAQAFKKGTYRALGQKAYGELKGPSIEAQKAIARGLKEDVQTEVAKTGIDIAPMNAREGAAITAKEAVGRRLALSGNRDPGGLTWIAGNPGAFLVALAQRSDAFKSLLARGLYNEAALATGVTPQVIRLAAMKLLESDGAK